MIYIRYIEFSILDSYRSLGSRQLKHLSPSIIVINQLSNLVTFHMKIIYNQNNYFSIYSTSNKHIETIFDSLENIIHSVSPSDYLLLPEDYFIFTLKHFNFYSSKPFTLSTQKQLIQNHCISDKKNNT